MPEVEPIPPIEGESQVGKTGRLLVSFVEPGASREYWWLMDAQGQEVLRWGYEILGKDFQPTI